MSAARALALALALAACDGSVRARGAPDARAAVDSGNATAQDAAVSLLACEAFAPAASAGTTTEDELVEASGLAESRSQPGVFWTHNDSGHRARVYALDASGRALARFELKGAASIDWEDVALGPAPGREGSFLYVGDIGDNAERRASVTVYRFAEPRVDLAQPGDAVPRIVTDFETFDLTYPDGPHDAEALLVDPARGELLLVTKERTRDVLAYSAGVLGASRAVSLTALGKVPIPREPAMLRLVTAGSVSPDGTALVLRTYGEIWLFTRPRGGELADALQSAPCSIAGPTEPQGEGIAFGSAGISTISEGAHPPLFHLPRR